MENLEKFHEILQSKVDTIVEAIKNADPTTKEYRELLMNYDSTMVVAKNIEMTILAMNSKPCDSSQCCAPAEN